MSTITLRDAVAADVPTITRFIHALAAYEKLAHACVAQAADIERWLFGERPRAHAVIAECDGAPAGFALYFYNFSTFLAKPGLYVEDAYVAPEQRGRGIGTQLFRFLAAKAVAEGCGRMEWWVLDWNQPAMDFYRAIHAVPMEEWTVQRLEGDALRALANAA